jgi:signal transduction histidine kinase
MTATERAAAPADVGWRDVLVTVIVASASLIALLLSDEAGARTPDPIAVALLLAMAAPLTVRRRWPTGAMVAVGVLAMASFAAGYPGGPPTIPLLVALYTIAAAGHRWWTIAVTVVFAGGGLLFRAVVEDDPPVSIALDSALFVLVSLLGDAVHTRRRLVAETHERMRLAASERDAEAQRRVTEERLRIARELHDIMAHTITTMSVQAGAALDALDHQPDQTRTALTGMRTASRQALQELRATVSLLRSSAPDDATTRQPAPGLDQLQELLDRVRDMGLDLDHHVFGTSVEVTPALQLTAYRVIQEGLTNVIRHSNATSATIRLNYSDEQLRVQIDDDGDGFPRDHAEGFGLRGLRERVDAIGGTLSVGPAPSGGFRLRADLPYLENDR